MCPKLSGSIGIPVWAPTVPPYCHVLVHVCLFTSLLCPRTTTWRHGLTCLCTLWVLSLLLDTTAHAHGTPAIGQSSLLHVPPVSYSCCVLSPDSPVCTPAVPSTGTWWCVHMCPMSWPHNLETQAFLFTALLYPSATRYQLGTPFYTPAMSQSQDMAALACQLTYMQMYVSM